MACNGFGKHCFVYLNPALLYQAQMYIWQLLGEKQRKSTHTTLNAQRLTFIGEIKTVKNVHN